MSASQMDREETTFSGVIHLESGSLVSVMVRVEGIGSDDVDRVTKHLRAAFMNLDAQPAKK